MRRKVPHPLTSKHTDVTTNIEAMFNLIDRITLPTEEVMPIIERMNARIDATIPPIEENEARRFFKKLMKQSLKDALLACKGKKEKKEARRAHKEIAKQHEDFQNTRSLRAHAKEAAQAFATIWSGRWVDALSICKKLAKDNVRVDIEVLLPFNLPPSGDRERTSADLVNGFGIALDDIAAKEMLNLLSALVIQEIEQKGEFVVHGPSGLIIRKDEQGYYA